MSYATASYVGFGPRFLAYIIDAIILGVVGIPLTILRNGSDSAGIQTLSSLLSFAIGLGYFVYFWGSTGQTLGKRVMGQRVVGGDGATGGIGYGPAVLRYIGMVIGIAVFFLGVLWAIWDSEKQGWHDKIAGTHVVSA